MIELSDIAKRYGSSSHGIYIRHLAIPRGEVVGILGENGSGKTTLLKAIMGLGELQGGTVRIEGRPVQQQYDKLAFVTEEGSFLPHMTPLEYGHFLAKFFPLFDHKHYRQLLELYALDGDRRIRTFSKGQKLKLEISAGLAKQADYILMDEPLIGKDLLTRQSFLRLLVGSLHGEETVLIATHLIDEIENVIDRAIILRQGLVKADVYMDDLRDQGGSLRELLAEHSSSLPIASVDDADIR